MSTEVRQRLDDMSVRRHPTKTWSMLGSSSSLDNRPSAARSIPSPQRTKPQIQRKRGITVRDRGDGVMIFTGIIELTKTLFPRKRLWSTTPEEESDSDDNTLHISVKPAKAPDSVDEEGPNDRGTYSREYTLRHPEITWIHRGQGRYLPDTQVKQTLSTASSQSSEPIQRRRSSVTSNGRRTSRQVIDRSKLSPNEARKNETTYSLRQKNQSQEPTAAERRASRMARRNEGYNEDDESDEEPQQEEEVKTYRKPYVDSHPHLRFKHCGNGFYKLIPSQDNNSDHESDRRGSTRSIAQSDISPTTLDQNQTVHASELKNYPGERFLHRGNGYYRRESAISAGKESNASSVTQDDYEDDPTMSNVDSFTRAEVNEYKKQHPGVVFIHRGNGRYKRLTDVATEEAKSAAMDPEDRITYSKDYVDEHPDDTFYHCGYGRYKKGVKPSRPSLVSSDEDGREVPLGLVDKQYVDDHPELVFHHRGQGRYALGPRNVADRDVSPVDSDTPAARESRETLYDRAYVDAHPEEVFHHRGQGKWKRGMPPPGSSNKMAVRGPGVQTSKSTSSATSSVIGRQEDMPGLFDLLRREDGPEKWPNVSWYYRGGGKWSRSTKEQADRATRSGNRTRPSESVELDDVEVESNATTSRRGSIFGSGRAGLKRKHSTANEYESAMPPQKKSNTPRLQPLTSEQDHLTDADLPELYQDEWSPVGPDDENDDAAQLMRTQFRPLTNPEQYIRSLTKYDPSVRSTENLYILAAHHQQIMQAMQDEYLALDKITAPHARIARKVAQGGRVPVDPQIFEDKKEADLYDYVFDPKKAGFQNPEAQRVTRDADGRELRKRNRRTGHDIDLAIDEIPLGKRVSKPSDRFDGTPGTTRRRRRVDAEGSVTPDRVVTPDKSQFLAESFTAPTSGRWAGHVPKRIRELRGNSVGPTRNATDEENGEEFDEVQEAEISRRMRSFTGAGSARKASIVASIEDGEEDVTDDVESDGDGDLYDDRL